LAGYSYAKNADGAYGMMKMGGGGSYRVAVAGSIALFGGVAIMQTSKVLAGTPYFDLRQELFKQREHVKTQEQDIATTDIPSDDNKKGNTYYHSTTVENAALIASTNTMYGSEFENYYVFAFRKYPNKYAIKNSGAHTGVIISFKTSAIFVRDTGINDIKVKKFGPVVSSRPGPISVWDVKVVG